MFRLSDPTSNSSSSDPEKSIDDLITKSSPSECDALLANESFSLKKLDSNPELFKTLIDKSSVAALELHIINEGKDYGSGGFSGLSDPNFSLLLEKIGLKQIHNKIFSFLTNKTKPIIFKKEIDESYVSGLHRLTSQQRMLELMRETYNTIPDSCSSSTTLSQMTENTNYSLTNNFTPIVHNIELSATNIEFQFTDANRRNLFQTHLETKFGIYNDIRNSPLDFELTLGQFTAWLGHEALRDILDVAILYLSKNVAGLKTKISSLPPYTFNLAMLLKRNSATCFSIIYPSFETEQEQRDLLNKFYDETLLTLLEDPRCEKTVTMVRGNVFNERLRLAKRNIISSLETIYNNPKLISPNNNDLFKIELNNEGRAFDTWSVITKRLLQMTPTLQSFNNKIFQSDPAHSPTDIDTLDLKLFINSQQLTFKKLLGRTLLFQAPDNKIVALKIQKTNHDEPIEELIKEFYTAKTLRESAELKMESDIPEPLQLGIVENIVAYVKSQVSPEDFDMFTDLVGTATVHALFVYKNTNDYFIYLHDPLSSEDIYRHANRVAIHDLYHALARGMVYTQLAKLFHTTNRQRPDAGRYIVLTNILQLTPGTGHLHDWMNSIDFPNIRASGLADLGDWISIDKFIGKTPYVDKFYGDTWQLYPKHSANLLIANVMAEYQYVLFLIAGKRAYDLTVIAKKNQASNTTIDDIWLNAAKQIMTNCIQAITIFSQREESKIQFFLNSIIDVNRLAKQMRYWMTKDYIPHFMNNKIPEDIYGPNVAVDIQFEKLRPKIFYENVGFSVNGIDPDLGSANGQEPIKEANKLMYWMVTMILTDFLQSRLAVQDYMTIRELAKHDVKKATLVRRQSFNYLPDKQKQAMQFFAIKAISKDGAITADERTELKPHAANVISSFWKHKRKINQINTHDNSAKRVKIL